MQKKIKQAAAVLIVALIVLNLICAAASLAGVNVHGAELSLARLNSMLAAMFAFWAWAKNNSSPTKKF